MTELSDLADRLDVMAQNHRHFEQHVEKVYRTLDRMTANDVSLVEGLQVLRAIDGQHAHILATHAVVLRDLSAFVAALDLRLSTIEATLKGTS